MKIFKFFAFTPGGNDFGRTQVYVKAPDRDSAENKLSKLGYFSIEFIQEIWVIP